MTQTTEFTEAQAARLAAIEAADPAPESWQPNEACRRVLDLADAVERGDLSDLTPKQVSYLIRVAVTDSAAVLCEQQKEG